MISDIFSYPFTALQIPVDFTLLLMRFAVTNRKPLTYIRGFNELLTGIGPVTSALPMRRTTDCATAA